MRATTILSLFVFPTVVTTLPTELTYEKRDALRDAILHATYGAYSELAPSCTTASEILPTTLRLTEVSTEDTSSTLSPTTRLAIITSASITGSLLLLALIIYFYFRRTPSPRTQAPVVDPFPNPPLSPTSIRIVGVSEVPEAVEDIQGMANVRSPWSPINPGFPEIGPVDFSRSDVQPGTRVDASQTHLPIAERDESGFFSTSSIPSRNAEDMVRSNLS